MFDRRQGNRKVQCLARELEECLNTALSNLVLSSARKSIVTICPEKHRPTHSPRLQTDRPDIPACSISSTKDQNTLNETSKTSLIRFSALIDLTEENRRCHALSNLIYENLDGSWTHAQIIFSFCNQPSHPCRENKSTLSVRYTRSSSQIHRGYSPYLPIGRWQKWPFVPVLQTITEWCESPQLMLNTSTMDAPRPVSKHRLLKLSKTQWISRVDPEQKYVIGVKLRCNQMDRITKNLLLSASYFYFWVELWSYFMNPRRVLTYPFLNKQTSMILSSYIHTVL